MPIDCGGYAGADYDNARADRERRFIEASQRPHGVLVNNLLDTEDRLRALKDQVKQLAAALTSASQ